MTAIELNNKIIDLQYKRLFYAKEGIIIKNNTNDLIILKMCYDVLSNETEFNNILNNINNIINGRSE